MIKCSECGKEISGSAVSCPNCGAPGEAKKARNTIFLTLFIIGAVVVVLLAVGASLGLL